MQSRWAIALLLIALASVVSAQETPPPDVLSDAGLTAQELTVTLQEGFDSLDAWENYSNDSGSARVNAGAYRLVYDDSATIWGQNETLHSDVIIRVETTQLSAEENNGYGIMCRADPANTLIGYHLWISGDGFATIIRITEDDTVRIADWERQAVINTGQSKNEIIAVCAGDYLALWANGTLVAQANDSTLTSGVTGFSAITYEDGTNVEILFDNLVIWETQAVATPPETTTETTTGMTTETSTGRLAPIAGRLRSLSADPAPLIEYVNTVLEQGLQAATAGSLLLDEPFNSQSAWESYSEGDRSTGVEDGRYVIRADDLLWGQNRTIEGNSIIRVETQQLSTGENNGYGIMCRADPANSGDGYHFYISGDGYWSLYLFDGRLEDRLTPLVGWTRSEAINTGQASNVVMAVCKDDYLAWYANGVLLGEYRDNTFDVGATGFIALSLVDGESVEIAFDNLHIWAVEP